MRPEPGSDVGLLQHYVDRFGLHREEVAWQSVSGYIMQEAAKPCAATSLSHPTDCSDEMIGQEKLWCSSCGARALLKSRETTDA